MDEEQGAHPRRQEGAKKCNGCTCKCCCGTCCLVSVLLLVLIPLPGLVKPKPPPVPFYILKKFIGPYSESIETGYPAYALMSSAPFVANTTDMPSQATPYDVCLEPSASARTDDLPDTSDVFDKLFARREFVEEPFGFNLLHCTFVNFFLEDFFRTVPKTEGSWVNRGTGLLSQVYGTSPERVHALRSLIGGRMKLGTDGKLPRWADLVQDHPELGLKCKFAPGYERHVCLQESAHWYACGDERCNSHPGFLFWSTVFVRHHNSLCDMLAERHPQMTDDELFEVARKINVWSMFKIVWEEYVFRMTCAKDLCTVPFDPEVIRKLGFPRFSHRHPTRGMTSMSLEFNQLYQWHFWIPDKIFWDSTGATSTEFVDLIWMPEAFKNSSFQAWGEAFHRTPMGHIQARNYPTFMKSAFQKHLEYSRANKLASYNTYRAFFNLPPFTSWEAFGTSHEVTEELKELYGGDIDRVEFQVGLFVDNAKDPRYEAVGLVHPLPSSLKKLVASFAISYVRNLPPVADPNYLTVANLKEEGVEYAKALTLEKMLEMSGIRGLGEHPNELPESWHPSSAVNLLAHTVLGWASVFR